MPLSNNERQKRFREKKTERIGYEAARREDNERRRRKLTEKRENPEEYERFKAKQAERKRKSRRERQAKIKWTGFSTRSTGNRSLRRAQSALPREKSQKQEVVKKLFETSIGATPKKRRLISQWMKMPGDRSGGSQTRSGRPCVITDAVAEKLKNFLDRSDISYNLPGRNNQIYMGKDDQGEKIFKPKKYLLYTFNQLHTLVQKQEDPDLAGLKFSTVYRFIRENKDYVGHSKIPHVTCQCPDCENMQLLIHGVNQALSAGDGAKLSENCHDLLEQVACSPITKLCSEYHCPDCPFPEEICEMLNDVEAVHYMMWRKDGKYYEKKPTSSTGPEAATKLREQLVQLKHHYYIKRVQSQEYLHQIDNLAEDEILIHTDYSENYKNRQADEIKAAYFGHQQFSIYTACVYYRGKDKVEVKNFGLVTQENDHSCDATFKLNLELIKEMEKSHKFSKIKFWSDGCSSQFRSQYTFYMMTKFPVEYNIEWHYFQANHGKGAVDGIGGTIKNSVFRRVLSKEVVISGPEHFATFADSILPSINVKFIQAAESGFDDECRNEARPVPGTLKVHKVLREAVTGGFKLTLFDSSAAENNMVKERMYTSAGTANVETPSNSNPLKRGDFVIITYEGEKFPGEISKVERLDPPMVTVKCMKKDKASGSIWCWPCRDDEVEHYDMRHCLRAEKPKLYGLITDRVLKYYVSELVDIWGAVDLRKCNEIPE